MNKGRHPRGGRPFSLLGTRPPMWRSVCGCGRETRITVVHPVAAEPGRGAILLPIIVEPVTLGWRDLRCRCGTICRVQLGFLRIEEVGATHTVLARQERVVGGRTLFGLTNMIAGTGSNRVTSNRRRGGPICKRGRRSGAACSEYVDRLARGIAATATGQQRSGSDATDSQRPADQTEFTGPEAAITFHRSGGVELRRSVGRKRRLGWSKFDIGRRDRLCRSGRCSGGDGFSSPSRACSGSGFGGCRTSGGSHGRCRTLCRRTGDAHGGSGSFGYHRSGRLSGNDDHWCRDGGSRRLRNDKHWSRGGCGHRRRSDDVLRKRCGCSQGEHCGNRGTGRAEGGNGLGHEPPTPCPRFRRSPSRDSGMRCWTGAMNRFGSFGVHKPGSDSPTVASRPRQYAQSNTSSHAASRTVPSVSQSPDGGRPGKGKAWLITCLATARPA